MISQVVKQHFYFRWKRFVAVFLLAGVTVNNFVPVYVQENVVRLSVEDWLLEVSGSLLVIYFFATLSVVLLTFDATKWLWTTFGLSSLARIDKRSTLFWSYTVLIISVVTYVLTIILFWTFVIGYRRFDGYATMNSHPFFKLTNSPVLFIVTRWLIDWWGLLFIAILGAIGAFWKKNVLFAFFGSFGWSFTLLAVYKSGLSLKGLLPGEGMLLSIHEHGVAPIWIAVVNEISVLFVLCILYHLIARITLVVPRADQ